MIPINDSDEKKMILACYFLKTNKGIKNLFTNGHIYAYWTKFWHQDFRIDGKKLRIFRNKFVVSANKDRAGVEPPAYYYEYNAFINSISQWMYENYEKKLGRTNNRKKYEKILTDYRTEKGLELSELIKDHSDYQIEFETRDSSQNIFYREQWYHIKCGEEIVFSGTYTESKEWILTELK